MATGFGLSATLNSANNLEGTQSKQFVGKLPRLASLCWKEQTTEKVKIKVRDLSFYQSPKQSAEKSLIPQHKKCLEEFKEVEL